MLAEGPQSTHKTVALDCCQYTIMWYVSGTYKPTSHQISMCSRAWLTRTSKLSKSWSSWWLSKPNFRIFWRWFVSAQGVCFTRQWEKLQMLNLILAWNNITVSFPFLVLLSQLQKLGIPVCWVSEIGVHEKPQGNHMESLVFYPGPGNPTIHIDYLVFDTASLWKNVVIRCTV